MFYPFCHWSKSYRILGVANLFPVFIILYSLFIMQSCSHRVSSTKLIDAFSSCMSSEECERLLSPAHKWNVVEDQRISPTAIRSQFDVLTVSIDSYTSLGLTGKLVLRFYNNRLISTWFYPSDFKEYTKKLSRQLGVQIIPGLQTTIGRCTELRCVTDHLNEVYVAWEDKRLIKEQSEWIKKHS